MSDVTYYDDPRAVLIHYNQNHDPKTGRFTSSKVQSLASTVHKQAAKRVAKVESDVKEAAAKTSAQMYGLEHKQKTLESIARKIATDAHEKGISYEDAASDIKDAIRFTTLSSDSDFVKNYETFKSAMADKGYEELRCKNYWSLYNEGKAKHKQVTSVFGEPGGYRFEVQFQTPSSIDAKEKKTKLYEEVRKEGVSTERKNEIVKAMEQLAETVSDPKGIDKIKNH